MFQTVLMVHKRARLLQLAEGAEKTQQNPIEELLVNRGEDEGLVTWDEGHIGLLPTDLFHVYQHFLVLVPDTIESDGTLMLGSSSLSHLLRIIWMR